MNLTVDRLIHSTLVASRLGIVFLEYVTPMSMASCRQVHCRRKQTSTYHHRHRLYR